MFWLKDYMKDAKRVYSGIINSNLNADCEPVVVVTTNITEEVHEFNKNSNNIKLHLTLKI